MSRIEITHELRDSCLGVLFASLLFLLLIVPLFERQLVGRIMMHAALTVVLVTAAIATRRRVLVLVFGLVVASIAVPLTWLTMLLPYRSLFVANCVLESAFFAMMAIWIIMALLQRELSPLNSLFGALSGYLLLGLSWAMLYLAIERLEGESLYVAHDLATKRELGDISPLSQLIYFSFVTMSTLGFGDIVPETSIARTFAWMQSVVGQFYMAVLVAWLVSEIPRRRRHDQSPTRIDSRPPRP